MVTAMSSSTLMEPFKPMRTTKWSSTTMIRIFFSTAVIAIRFSRPRAGPARPAPSVDLNSPLTADFHADFCALAGGADHGEVAAHFFRALAHVKQTEMAAVSDRGVGGVESDAIIVDTQGDFARFIVQLDGDAGGAGVLEGVGQSFLGDAE